MKVTDAMTASTVTARPSMSLRDVWKLIIKKHVNSVIIVDAKGCLEGIVVREDLLSMIFPKYEEYLSDIGSVVDFKEMEDHVRTIGNKCARDIMKTQIIFAHEDTELMRALSRMIVHHVDQLPVVSRHNRVLGILTKSDVFSILFRKRSHSHKK
jgi:CBS domain-containing protein